MRITISTHRRVEPIVVPQAAALPCEWTSFGSPACCHRVRDVIGVDYEGALRHFMAPYLDIAANIGESIDGPVDGLDMGKDTVIA